jgi:hypothetical protein
MKVLRIHIMFLWFSTLCYILKQIRLVSGSGTFRDPDPGAQKPTDRWIWIRSGERQLKIRSQGY